MLPVTSVESVDAVAGKVVVGVTEEGRIGDHKRNQLLYPLNANDQRAPQARADNILDAIR
jgi:hypothetical protein